MRTTLVLITMMALVASCSTPTTPVFDQAALRQQVMSTERAFARTMADRNFAAFQTYLSDDAVFFSDDRVLRGKGAVAAAWQPLFAKANAPFSWEPDQVEILGTGDLALSTGPVRDGAGKLVATFTSIWRLEAPATWRIVFDKGNDVCDCASK
jgi:ketosteroid isomerase-like protein